MRRSWTWAEAPYSELIGRHQGWSLVEPISTHEEINVQFVDSRERGFIGTVDRPPRFFIEGSSASETVHELIEFLLARGEGIILNADAHVGWPYHADPSDPDIVPPEDRPYYAQSVVADPTAYAEWVGWLAERYPSAIIQIMNEPDYQRGANLTEAGYAATVLAAHEAVAGRVQLMAGGGGQDTDLEAWASDPRLDDVILGIHGPILHRIYDPATLRATYRSLCEAARARHPNREIDLDETLPVGYLPGGTTTDLGADLYEAAMLEWFDLEARGVIQGVGMGFPNGLGDPCSEKWRVCAGLLTRSGELVKAGVRSREVAADIGWMESGGGGGGEPPCEEVLSDVRRLSERARLNVRKGIKKTRGVGTGAERDAIRKPLRRAIVRLRELEAIAKAGGSGSAPGGGTSAPEGLTEADVEEFAWLALNRTAVALRFETSGVWVDWRDGSTPHPTLGPRSSVAAAIREYRRATSG